MAAASSSGRRQPTRSVRTTASRPTNYYAKPFSYRSSGAALVDNDPPPTAAPGFFPAITHFTDGLAALPKEVQRHFTTLKETEGKAYQPDQAIAELVAAIRKLPQPPNPHYQDRPLPYMQLSMTNSANASVSGSVVDGVLPKASQSFHPNSSDLDLADATQSQLVDEFSDRRQDLYARLRLQVGQMTNILEEKNMVLNTANETLGRQLLRLESSFPHIESEVSEDARLGSNTHWALPHMKDMRRTNGSMNDRRRDVTNVNNLAAAAAAVHEGEIAATRSEARREAMLAKRSRMQHSDYGFDDRMSARKASTSAKVRKAADAPPALNGSASKRRRVEKSVAAPNERAMSAALHGRLHQQGRNASRDGSVADTASRKKPKPPPTQQAARKKVPNSPSLASSPTRGTFSTSNARTQSPGRASLSRAPPNPVASLVQDAARKRRNSASSTRRLDADDTPAQLNGGAVDDRAPLDRDAASLADAAARPPSTAGHDPTDAGIKRESAAPAPAPDTAPAPPTSSHTHSRANSRSHILAGGKPPTPINIFADAAPIMARSRSGRGANPSGAPPAASPSGAASPVKRSHKKGGNASAAAAAAATSSSSIATNNNGAPAPASVPATATPDEQSSDDASSAARRARARETPTSAPSAPAAASTMPTAAAQQPDAARAADDPDEADASAAEDDGDGEGEGEGAEPLYCFCQQPSEGEMIACDNDACPTEWFHLECVQLARAPKNSWYCSEGCKRQALRGRR